MTRTEYLLIKLSEEAGELVQACAKANIFGLKDRYSKKRDCNNEEQIAREMTDLIAVGEMLREAGVNLQTRGISDAAIRAKKAKVEKWMKYSRELGIITD